MKLINREKYNVLVKFMICGEKKKISNTKQQYSKHSLRNFQTTCQFLDAHTLNSLWVWR